MTKLFNHGVLAGAVCLALALGTACSDDGGTEMGGDETTGDSASGDGDGDMSGDGDGDMGDLSYADIQAIWDTSCIGCHSPAGSADFLDLSGDSYGNVVGAMSGQATDLQIIEAGSSGTSYLVNKIMGTQADAGGVGNIMPPVGDPLSAEQITTITDWIDAGATP